MRYQQPAPKMIDVMHKCGHAGQREDNFEDDPNGDEARAFEADRPCSDCWIAEYRSAQARRTPEQLAEQRYEARAAFGPGVEVVNVVTGETYLT